MDLSNMLSTNTPDAAGVGDVKRQTHQYSTRHGATDHDTQPSSRTYHGAPQRPGKPYGGSTTPSAYSRGSPAKVAQKHVVFQLIDPENPHIQARLPMRVMIAPHDTTESIITTLKNFYGLYDQGVSFETKEGISIIAAFNNFENDMTVYVRTVPQPQNLGERGRDSVSPKRPSLGPAFEMRPPGLSAAHSPSRSAARSAGVRSMSPQSDVGRLAGSAVPGRVRSNKSKSMENSVAGDVEGHNSDAESVSSSRRSKAEEIKADITVDNIVEGGRRKRAFESSELPLFVPPQVPVTASNSSVSPQRRHGPLSGASPYASSNQQTFTYSQAMPSPLSYGGRNGHSSSGIPANPYQNNVQPANRQLRGSRPSGSYSHRSSNGVIPTPDPTVGSAISDEDVALQLMRLGDPSAFSYGRTSTSTVDDALSGKAEAASSDEEDDEEDEGETGERRFSSSGPQKKKQRMMNELPSEGTSGEEYEDQRDGTFRGESDGAHTNGYDNQPKLGKAKTKNRGTSGPVSASAKTGKPRTLSMTKAKKTPFGSNAPMSPTSLPTQSRKASISSGIHFQHPLGDDEEDLSSKPRCQRCRKSKKGCDRQRPCGRCKDAGIGAEGCLSEDEGNGRKGRYGRHMGVTIKKAGEAVDDSPLLVQQQQHQHQHQHQQHQQSPLPPLSQTSMPANGYFLAPALPDKANKKRKR